MTDRAFIGAHYAAVLNRRARREREDEGHLSSSRRAHAPEGVPGADSLKALAPKERFIDLRSLRTRVTYNPDTGAMLWTAHNRADRVAKEVGWIRPDGYRVVCFGHRRGPVMLHRLIWFYVHGHWPADQIDHINGKRSDNRLCNLREATPAQNNVNRAAKHGRLFKGVTQLKSGRWQAQIRVSGKNMYLGTFLTAEEAGAVYAANAKLFFGSLARQA